MSQADELEHRTREAFERELQRLVAEAHENGTDLEGAYVTELDETTDVEVLLSEVKR